MIILLLTLLAIALTVTFAGLLLSPKPHVQEPHNPRGVSYAGRNDGVRRVSANKQVRVRRYTVEAEPRTWETILSSMNVGRIFRPRIGEQTPWLGIMLILLALFGLGILSLRTLLPNPGLIFAASFPDAVAAAPATTTNSQNSNAALFSGLSGASKALVRISQLDPAQYGSMQEYNTWAYSACSTTSMTEVINAYGHKYRITDILNVETGVHAISANLGLLEPTGIDRTVARFNFQAIHLNNPSLDDVLKIANQGRPVIVGFPPQRWAGGHLLVVIGGTNNSVYLADSSRLNMQVMARATFMRYWGGLAVVVTPK